MAQWVVGYKKALHQEGQKVSKCLGKQQALPVKRRAFGEKGSGLAAWAAVHAVFDHLWAEFELGVNITQCGTHPFFNHRVIEGHI
mgnify:CR=1 FL=1